MLRLSLASIIGMAPTHAGLSGPVPGSTLLLQSWAETLAPEATLAMASCSGMGGRFPGGLQSVASQNAILWGFPGGF